MNDYNYVGNIGINIKIHSSYYSIETNCHYLYNDMIYFIKSGKNYVDDIEISKRYARAAILFLASYVDCLSNLLISEIEEKFKCGMDIKNIFGKNPSIKFKIGYKQLLKSEEFPIDLKGMKDFYDIVRSQIIVHPPAQSIKLGTGVVKGKGLTYDKKNKTYKKLKNLPNILSEFDINNMAEIYNEIRIFLNEYYSLINNVIQSSILNKFFHLEKI